MNLYDYCINNGCTELLEQWDEEKNKEFSPKKLTYGSKKLIWWRCEKGHEWQARLYSRVHSGRNCPVCTNQRIIPGENDMATVAPEMAKWWHPELNGSLTPSDVSPGSRKNVWWQCDKGHSWRAPVYSIKAGSFCPYCAGNRVIPGETDLASTHPHVLKLWSSRNELPPTQVTASSNKKAWWICEKGHEWEADIESVVMEGCGCPYCAGKRAIPGETDLVTMRPDIMKEWDTEKNSTNPREILPSAHVKVWWKCELGHSWQAVVFSRTREKASGCPYCTGRKVLPGFNDLATRKPKLAKEWYQPLNGELKPDAVTSGSTKKVWWQCSDGHVWQAYIYARTKKNGTGCPVCAGVVKRRKSSTFLIPDKTK